MLDMVDMFFIILLMLLCKFMYLCLLKSNQFVMSFNKHVWRDTSLYQVGKKIEKDVFLFSHTGGSEEKKLSIPTIRVEPPI